MDNLAQNLISNKKSWIIFFVTLIQVSLFIIFAIIWFYYLTNQPIEITKTDFGALLTKTPLMLLFQMIAGTFIGGHMMTHQIIKVLPYKDEDKKLAKSVVNFNSMLYFSLVFATLFFGV